MLMHVLDINVRVTYIKSKQTKNSFLYMSLSQLYSKHELKFLAFVVLEMKLSNLCPVLESSYR